MVPRLFYTLGLLTAAAAAESGFPPNADYAAAVKSISAELSSPTFKAYAKPAEPVREFIAVGDSYTAGCGANGDVNGERFGQEAYRGKHSYPMQMYGDADNWIKINGDKALPRFSFPAYTGDTSVELIKEQLTQGDYKPNNREFPRAQPFGKPQLAVMTIGGNDAMLATILNDCIYRAYRPGDCDKTIETLQKDIENGALRNKIINALFRVTLAGRTAGGVTPPENFQVYALGYSRFFNDKTTKCNDFSWSFWGWSTPKMTQDLRIKLNKLTSDVNGEIKKAADELKAVGVIYVDGIDDLYEGHRYCEPRHTDYKMIDYETWFWSPEARYGNPSEGPGDPNNPYPSSLDTAGQDPGQQLLDFVFPGQNKKVSETSADNPPWKWPGADKYPDFLSLLHAMQKDEPATPNTLPIPFPYIRSFHPKGTAYGKHRDMVFTAINENRGLIKASGGANYTLKCKDWIVKDADNQRLLVGTCKDKDGKEVRSQEDLALCLRYENGNLIPADNGQFTKDCKSCFFNDPIDSNDTGPEIRNTLWCNCESGDDGFVKSASIKLDEFMKVQDDGYVKCFDHKSKGSSYKRWESGKR